MYPVEKANGVAVVVFTYLARERPNDLMAPRDLLCLEIQVGPKEGKKVKLDAFTLDPDFGQVGRMCLPGEYEVHFDFDSSWSTRVDCFTAGLIQVHFMFPNTNRALAAYIPREKLPELKEVFCR